VALLTTKLGAISDEYNSTMANATTLTGSRNGIINNNNDVDYFSINSSSAVNVTLVPFSVSAANTGANLDLVLKIYNSQGQLMNTINDPAILNAAVSMPAGQYYFSVSVGPNSNAAAYGMIGKYIISQAN
jgi:hypothetical protein